MEVNKCFDLTFSPFKEVFNPNLETMKKIILITEEDPGLVGASKLQP